MTLREYLISAGYMLNPTATKARCPFHEDSRPSAMVHDDDNTIWCFACRRLYGPKDFLRYGILIDTVEAGPALKFFEYPWGTPLFYC